MSEFLMVAAVDEVSGLITLSRLTPDGKRLAYTQIDTGEFANLGDPETALCEHLGYNLLIGTEAGQALLNKLSRT